MFGGCGARGFSRRVAEVEDEGVAEETPGVRDAIAIGLHPEPGVLQLHHAEAFAETLRMVLHVPVAMQDERFTTVEAERELRGAGLKGPARRSVVDAEAARIALQAWLDARRSGASAG